MSLAGLSGLDLLVWSLQQADIVPQEVASEAVDTVQMSLDKWMATANWEVGPSFLAGRIKTNDPHSPNPLAIPERREDD